MLKPDSIAGKSFFGATREELPAPRNRVKVGTIVALVEVGAQRGHTATVTEVCPGGKIRFADGDVTESCDQYHLCVYDAVGRWIY